MKTYTMLTKYYNFTALAGASLTSIFLCTFTNKVLAQTFVKTDFESIVCASSVLNDNRTVINYDKSQHLQNKNKLNKVQINEYKRRQTQLVLPENVKPDILPGCTFVRPCPTNSSPIGCIVCH